MDEIAKEEYKHIFGLAIQIEQRMLQLFMLSVAVSVSLLSGICALLFSADIPERYSLLSTHLVLVPNLITVSAFILILSHRIALVRLSAYKSVFHEDKSELAGWGRRLHEFRKLKDSEAHDHIPITYWAILLVSLAIFVSLVMIEGKNHVYVLIGLVMVLPMAYFHYKWSNAVGDLQDYYDLWNVVKSKEV
jgi:hypothetical protein